jgi:hypothetical protein
MFSILTNHHSRKTFGFLELFTAKQFKDRFFERNLPLYEPKKKENSKGVLWIVLSVAICLLVCFGVLRFLKVRRLSAVASYDNPSSTMHDILKFWSSKSDYSIELSEINDFVNYDNPSPDTLKKRRETLLKQFCIEMAKRYNLQQDAIFSTQSHPKDKRMKILVLSTVLVNKIKKGN